MAEAYTTGYWAPKKDGAGAFIEAWTEFAKWAREQPGAGSFRLAAQLPDRTRYVSFGSWESVEAADAWIESPEFGERLGRVREHVDQFSPAELEVVAAVGGD